MASQGLVGADDPLAHCVCVEKGRDAVGSAGLCLAPRAAKVIVPADFQPATSVASLCPLGVNSTHLTAAQAQGGCSLLSLLHAARYGGTETEGGWSFSLCHFPSPSRRWASPGPSTPCLVCAEWPLPRGGGTTEKVGTLPLGCPIAPQVQNPALLLSRKVQRPRV